MYTEPKLFAAGHAQNYIHQIDFSTSDASIEDDIREGSREQKPRLVLIHGYGATGLMFYKCCDLLRREFRLTTIDMLGMGGSGRPPFHLKTCRDAVAFFVHSIEAWMRTQDDIRQEKPVLMGHSLGGLVSAHYALRYPERLKELMLCSPVGVPEAHDRGGVQNAVAR